MSVLKYKDASGAFHKVPLSATEEWGNVLNKPFSTIDTKTLKVTNGELSAIGSEVSVSQTLTEGTEIGSITVDGTKTKLYAPAQGTDFTLEVVDALPNEGENGVFYLVPATTTGTNNSYNEYVWIESSSKFELVGSTEIDLSEYLKEDDITVAQTLTEGTEIGSITVGDTETKLYAPSSTDSTWENVSDKPFKSLDTDDFSVDESGVLSVVGGGTEVSVTQTLTEGTEIGSVTVDGTETKLYAPEGGGSSADEIVVSSAEPTGDVKPKIWIQI